MVILDSGFWILDSKGKSRSGFTLIELLIFIAIFSVVIIAFISIFVSVLRVYSRQAGAAEVDRQSQFLLQNLQNDIQLSSVVDMPLDVPTTTLKLRMPSSAQDPTYVYSQNGVVYYIASTSAPEALTNSRVNVTNLSFVRRSSGGAGHDSVQLSFSMEFVSSNPASFFAQTLNTSIARVSAATFDSNLVASTSNTYGLGVGTANWSNINGTIYFSNAGNVGIGISSPRALLHISGGNVYIDSNSYGIIMKAPNNSCYEVGVTSNGVATGTAVACP